MQISIVITNWNGRTLLPETLPTVIQAVLQDPDHVYDIILVDDCSTDDSVSYVQENFPEVRIVSTPRNQGYMYANNFGVQNAKFPLVFSLNNDMKITASTIPPLAKLFEDPMVFAASGKIYDWENRFIYGNRGGEFKCGHFSYYEKEENDTESQTLFACGGAFLARKDWYLQLGGYDAELYSPYYYDETDLCFRALKRGWKILYEPASIAFHKISQTARIQYKEERIRVISARNNYYFSIKNIHGKNQTYQMLFFIPLWLLRDALLLRFRFWKAMYQVLKNWGLLMNKRNAEKNVDGLCAEAIFEMVNLQAKRACSESPL